MFVFIADDDKYLREGIATFLKKSYGSDVSVKMFANGVDALNAIRKNVPDVLITDIKMPLLDGLTLVSEIDKNIHIIILSAYRDFEFAKQAISLRVDAFITKPIDLDELGASFEQIYRDLSCMKNSCSGLSILLDEHCHAGKENSIIQRIYDLTKEEKGNISLNLLSSELSMNSSYLSVVFKEKTGKNFNRWLREIKATVAKYYLKETSRTIYQISEILGYCDAKSFSGMFKKETGYTPIYYRKKVLSKE